MAEFPLSWISYILVSVYFRLNVVLDATVYITQRPLTWYPFYTYISTLVLLLTTLGNIEQESLLLPVFILIQVSPNPTLFDLYPLFSTSET